MASKNKSRAGRTTSSLPAPRRSSKWIVLSTILAVIAVAYNVLDRMLDQFYIFTPQELHSLAQSAITKHPNNTRAVIDEIVSTLSESHGRTVNTNEEWIFNNAGGAMGSMYIIHASVTEYLIIFGTAVGTEGHTGRHTADDYFHILEGEQWAYKADALTKEVYPAGSVHHLVRGEVKQYSMPDTCWAMEYARGWIPPMLPFGFADTFFSTLDFPTLYHTVRITGREIIRNLLAGKF